MKDEVAVTVSDYTSDITTQASPKHAKSRGLLRNTSIVASGTMTSRLVGFARDMIVAQYFGVSPASDAFYIAFKIPNFMRRLFAEGSFSQAFVPILAEYQQTRSHSEVRDFISRIAGTLTFTLFFFTLFCVIFSPLIVHLFAPGFESGGLRYTLTVEMIRITFPYLFFISLAAMTGAILNTYGYFGIPSYTPVLLNICMISAVYLGASHFNPPILCLAWGVFAAGITQFVFQLPFLKKANLLPKPQLHWRDAAVVRVLKKMGPSIFGVSVAQINLMIDSIFASHLGIGGLSWLYFSDRLSNFPLGVFGVAISTVLLPPLSKHIAVDNKDAFAKALDWGNRSVLLMGIPSAVSLIILAGPILTTLFHYGAFKAHDVEMTVKSLQAFSLGLPAFMMVKIFASGFYACQDIRTPVRVGIAAMVCNTLLNFILIGPLQHQGLALSTSIAAYFNAGMLWWLLHKRKIYLPQAGWLRYSGQLFVANAAVAGLLLWGAGSLSSWLEMSWQWRALDLSLLIVGSVITYLAALFLTGVTLQDLAGKK